jgi:hypothetical protein
MDLEIELAIQEKQKLKKDEDNIIELIVKLMTQAQDLVNKSGIEKKAIVMQNLKYLIGQDIYVKNYYLIQQTIDFIAKIAKGDLKIIKKNYCFC